MAVNTEMLLAARENTVTERNGCVALCVSKDLHHWEYPTLYSGKYRTDVCKS
ncbi:MAG: hypothetical protein MJ116_06500 [Lachnospiraceae bacterium]|nr:hypothetical protein [Lachnospiraceae bacterium]